MMNSRRQSWGGLPIALANLNRRLLGCAERVYQSNIAPAQDFFGEKY